MLFIQLFKYLSKLVTQVIFKNDNIFLPMFGNQEDLKSHYMTHVGPRHAIDFLTHSMQYCDKRKILLYLAIFSNIFP